MINESDLIKFLDERQNAKSALVGAIYEGLAARVRSGEFSNGLPETVNVAERVGAVGNTVARYSKSPASSSWTEIWSVA